MRKGASIRESVDLKDEVNFLDNELQDQVVVQNEEINEQNQESSV